MEPMKLHVNQQSRPLAIANIVLYAIKNKQDTEIIPMDSEAPTRAAEALAMCKIKGQSIPVENGVNKIFISYKQAI